MSHSLGKRVLFALMLLLVCFWAGIAQGEVVVRQEMEKDIYAAIKGGRVLYLECHLPEGDAAKALLEKYLEQPGTWQSYKGITAVAIPYFKLNASSQRKLIESLFPEDYVDEKGWWHTVAFDGDSGMESWNSIALWLAGAESAYKAIMNAPENKGIGSSLKQGQTVLIPRAVLRKELSAPSPVRPKKKVMAALPVAPSMSGATKPSAKPLPASMTKPTTSAKPLPASMTEPVPAAKPLPASMTVPKPTAKALPVSVATAKVEAKSLPASMTEPKAEPKSNAEAEAKVAVAPVPEVAPAKSVQEEEARDVETKVVAVEPTVKGRRMKRGEKREKVNVAKVESQKKAIEEEPVLAALNPDIMETEGENGGDAAEGAVMNDISAPPMSSDLSYGSDKMGAYAVYKLKAGEALYSSVVVRFTDFSENAEIHAALGVIQQRSGISDPRKMTAGQAVKIPMDMLADKYHPQGSQERKQFEEIQTAVERVGTRRSVARDLEGVVLILDPGHGGRDQGAAPHGKSGIYEDEVVYDIACRVKEIIERDTRAKIYMTTQDPNQQYKVSNAVTFSHDTDEVLLTSPVYPNADAHVSANLRWYLANEIYRKELKNGTPSDKIIFASLHCDSLYTPQLRGAMVYVPGAQYRRDSEQPGGAIYANYSEVKQQPVVRTTYAQRVEDEALSRNFAQTLLNCLQENDPPIKVHDAGDPIRNVIRQSGGRAYVPAVLRNTVVPTKVLVETANLTNSIDCQRVADPQWRQSFANSFVVALRKHFASQNPPVQVAAKR